MEDWQELHINKHLPKLIQNTRCNASLKASLIAAGLITSEENQNLSAVGQNAGLIPEAAKLYEILRTKRHGYVGIYEALEENGQSGASELLRNSMQEHLLNISIQFGGSILPIRSMFPNLSVEDIRTLMQNADCEKELIALYKQDFPVLKLDGSIPEKRSLYISRSISNRLSIDPKVFQMDSDDVFVFKGIDQIKLVDLVGFNLIRSSSEQQTGITCRHIHLDDDEDWDYMKVVCKKPLHLIVKERNEYILQRSTEVTDLIRNNSSSKGRPLEVYVLEDHFIQQLLSQSNCNGFKGALICDVPGMGKTWLMESIARKYATAVSQELVYFFEATSLSKYLSEIEDSGENNDPRTALNFASKSNLAAFLLTQTAHKFKIMLCVDGFDELHPSLVARTTACLIKLSQCEHVNLIISSRPHMREHLESTFKLTSYDILPFSTEDQVKTLIKQWQVNFPTADEGRLEEFAHQCIKSTRDLQRNDTRNILGVPLQCYILATVNEVHVKQISLSEGRPKRFKVAEEAVTISIFLLYEKFVECSLQKIRTEEMTVDDFANLKEKLLKLHTFKALELLFPQVSQLYYMKQNMDHLVINDSLVRSVGILGNQNNEFVHRTFAEYFVAVFFSSFWMNNRGLEHTYDEAIAIFFFEHFLEIAWNYSVVEINFHRVHFNSLRLTYIQHIQKMGHFKSDTILWFLNSRLKNDGVGQVTFMKYFKLHLDSYKFLEFKEVLRKHLYLVIIGLAQEKFEALIHLLAHMVQDFFDDTDVPSPLLLNPYSDLFMKYSWTPDIRASVPFLLFVAACTGSPEVMQAVLSVINSSSQRFLLTDFLSRFPLDFYSPLEVAIAQSNYDMFINYHTQFKLPWQRLIIMSLVTVKEISESVINSCKKFWGAVIAGDTTKTCVVTVKILEDHLRSLKLKYCRYFDALKTFALKHKIRLHHLARYYKLQLLGDFIEKHSDEDLIKILILLFEKNEENTIQERTTYLDDEGIPSKMSPNFLNFEAEEVLKCLDVPSATLIFFEIWFDSSDIFSNIHKVETLKVLNALCPNFSVCNKQKLNYLHLAVMQGKIDWIKYLLQVGFDVNEQDCAGSTPILV